MPMILDNLPASASAFSPLKSNLEDMLLACEQLDRQLRYVVDDAEAFGLLTEDTYLENAPEILKLLERISAIARNSTRDLTFEDEVFEVDAASVAVPLYSFLSEHRRAIDVLIAHKTALRATGPYYDSLGRSLNSQSRVLQSFKAALEMRYQQVKERSVEQWSTFNTAMSEAVVAFPGPEILPVVADD